MTHSESFSPSEGASELLPTQPVSGRLLMFAHFFIHPNFCPTACLLLSLPHTSDIKEFFLPTGLTLLRRDSVHF